MFIPSVDSMPGVEKEMILGRWNFVSITSNKPMVWAPGTHATTDGTLLMDDCEKDDFVLFRDDNVYEENEGAVKCGKDDSQVYTSTWAVSGRNITIDGKEYKIVTLNDTLLKVAQRVEDRKNGDITVTVTMKRR